jgi:hypothetical protein
VDLFESLHKVSQARDKHVLEVGGGPSAVWSTRTLPAGSAGLRPTAWLTADSSILLLVNYLFNTLEAH